VEGRDALLRYVLRPPLAQDRLEMRPDGLVRVALKRAYADGQLSPCIGKTKSSMAAALVGRQRGG